MTRIRSSFWLAISGLIALAVGATAIAPYIRSARIVHPKTGKLILTPGADGDSTLLFNGWRISPAGRHIATGDMLLGGAISPDGTTLAIANAGYSAHSLHLIDIASEKELADIPLNKAWNGIAWSPDGKRIYVAGGVSNAVNDIQTFLKNANGEWAKGLGYKLTGNDPKNTCVSGITLSQDGSTVFALNVSDKCLYILDATSGASKSRLEVGDHPGACKLSKGGNQLYVTCWGGKSVAVVDVSNPSEPKITEQMSTGDHPNDLALSRDGRLFVSCGNSDVVTVLDAASRRPIETIKCSLTPRAPAGSTPNALALSPDGDTLYVANADNNAICVIDVSKRGISKVAGFIPTGWYPSAVLVSPDGKKIIACSGKGGGSKPNPSKSRGEQGYPGGFEHIGRQLSGMVSFVDKPDEVQLADYSKQVYNNSPYRDLQLQASASSEKTAIPSRIGDRGPIKYVLYIIKENRTYDQVYGDVSKGNGDPNLCLFGQDVTPNHHALSEQFVLLDNIYCSGEVSADGHPWSTSAIATDFTQRSWVLSYSGKGQPARSDSVADPSTGYIWDACARKGVTYRSYGEYVYASSSEAAPEQKVSGATGLVGHGSPKWVGIGRPRGQEYRDPDKADTFIEEFKEFEKKRQIPHFMIMSLGENHTEGTKAGAYTPKSHVAANDVALGKIVDAISHSRVWKEFAIFVIEDDAQNGPDHVDSHRTCGLVISPYTKHSAVDSTMYNTCSMLRTMELILGLPPMTQYDASATPMFKSFTDRADLSPFNQVPARISLNDRNPATAYGAKESGKMDFAEYDRVDEQALNRILWHSIKGKNVPMPAPVRRAVAMVDRVTR
jgi:YVTN family beta-propeller protein